MVLPEKEYLSAVNETAVGHRQRVASELAEANNLSPYVFDLLVTQESEWQPEAVGDGGLANNCAQFHKATFEWMKQKAGMPNLKYNNCEDQLKLMSYGMSHGYRNLWGTYKRLDIKKKELL